MLLASFTELDVGRKRRLADADYIGAVEFEVLTQQQTSPLTTTSNSMAINHVALTAE
jgi:hypothetical protein